MSLPKLLTPEFETIIPSTKEPIRFRPFLVKEEKILYMALESNDAKEIQQSTFRVLENCILTPGVEVNKLTPYDIEFLFLKLRAKSVGEIINLKLKHQTGECKAETDYALNLDEVTVKFNENYSDKVMITDKVGLKLKIPVLNDITNVMTETNSETLFKLLLKCIEYVFDEQDVYNDFTEEELQAFIDKLNKQQFSKIQNFFDMSPKLYHDIEWVCTACGKKESVRLEGLQSFFM